MKDKINLQSISDSNDESDEIAMRSKFYPNQFDDDDQSREEKIPDIEAVERLQNPEESNIHSVEHDHNDDDGDNNDYYKILRDSDED
ncbi:unnamed protein product [Rotaria sordida]|uniref:Uncharacterized protein n=1 Tax=Rotaria sordida TaxID=392033 RepID=A0A814LDR4_9BILA|nr:unnamed protein product [Rotaria sordida]CAF1064388.1 unnamed protein product [Rotaria sordida]